ncbi:aspartyl/asparaginyl beta-hydroxylase domain-containing protein [Paramagnetospirillum magneticum]|uniref:Aspartyl/asparaginy/proline hydroxylase domain-containing protein n=1 Tax=Paramagnetospirillum magneticum (strain ATCC 700264 / AMB-1) TaxID=342108 RepID=Q2W903_PARM1|nr:aspartyl/asparaginyl beta-hydroxylase domain-containing protein [Paramagnetospirillum magneticum]BAE49672.1 hypothetical protein amb0868 [Paramagnetospirillum magneticum AMB-1]
MAVTEASEVVRPAPEPLLPWQAMTMGSGLVLHGPADIACDHGALAAEFDRLDATLAQEERHCFGSCDGSWTSIPLTGWSGGEVVLAPLAQAIPAAAGFLSRLPGALVRAHYMRQGPGHVLDWHFEPQSIQDKECRLLVPIHAPPQAYTLLGHLAVAYPEGQAWTGDFNFPHKVVNPSDRDRIMLVVDVLSSPDLAALLPAALGEGRDLRTRLAGAARNALAMQRAA